MLIYIIIKKKLIKIIFNNIYYIYMSDLIIWVVLIFIFLIIIGLYISEFTPLDLNEKEKILKLNNITENFIPDISSSSEQSEGASGLYNWGLPEKKYNENKQTPKCEHKCNDECKKDCPLVCPTPKLPPVPECKEQIYQHHKSCINCDITKNRDIDKYVLKSSVPPCPDMSEFITKNMMNANPDLSDYILKSEVKPCEKADFSKYILKTQIPPCPTCPICPECPICPVCPPQQKCKEIHEYNISEHPNLSNYISKAELADKYIAKDQILNSDIVKNYLNKNCSSQKNPELISSKLPLKQIPQEESYYTQSSQSSHIPQTSKSSVNNTNNSSLLEDNVMGYYAGDSLFAGV